MIIALALLLAYLLGSIPFGLLLTRAAGLGDVRNIGSGNIGATNVLRTGNKWLALATLALDMGKGALAVWVAHLIIVLTSDPAPFYAPFQHIELFFMPLMVTIGHCYPIWLKGKGGKGVATAFGALLGCCPITAAIAIAIWLAVFIIWRISSLAALISFGTMPIVAWMVMESYLKIAIIILVIAPVSLLIFWRHRANIRRLLNGTEPGFGSK